MPGLNDRFEKEKTETKYRWETLYVIPLLSLVEVNHLQPILYMSKIMVHIYSENERINQFAIGFMINLSLHIINVFR